MLQQYRKKRLVRWHKTRRSFVASLHGNNLLIISLYKMKHAILKQDIIGSSPLREVVPGRHQILLPEGRFGAVLARAGLGKTAMLVQISLDYMLQDKKVLHVSLGDPVKKVTLWYAEVYRKITESYDMHACRRLWETILTNRFIMTFNTDRFSLPALKERLTDLTEQNIFKPDVLLFDDLSFNDRFDEFINELKIFTENQGVSAWFTVKIHRHQIAEIQSGILPEPLASFADMFDLVLQILPEQDKIWLKVIKTGDPIASSNVPLLLDPSSMLVQKENS